MDRIDFRRLAGLTDVRTLGEAVEPKQALAKLLKAAEKDLKPFVASLPGTVGLKVSQEFRDMRAGYGPYEIGTILLDRFTISVTVNLKDGEVSIGGSSGTYVLDSLWSKGTMQDAAKRLKKALTFVKEQAAEEAKKNAAPVAVPAKTNTVEDQLAAVKQALSGRKTKTGGRLRFSSQSASPYVFIDFEPEYRQRLDHYGTSYDDEGDEQEGWDGEGWQDDYATPLAKEVEALLKDAGLSDWVVDIGEKGHVEVQLPKKGGA